MSILEPSVAKSLWCDSSVRKVSTTCPYCGVGCGVVVSRDDAGSIKVNGDREHPANAGRLCSKGTALSETLDLEGRLLYPQVNGEQTTWEDALDTVALRFREIIDTHGPDSTAFYVSGQLLTEDYYVANKLMKGFIGSANIDTNSRLCMSSAVAAYKRAFGSDTVPTCYEDLDEAELVLLVGSNLAWCHPVIYQRLRAEKKRRPELKIVVIDPRETSTCDGTDLHLALQSGTDAFLFNGLLVWLTDNGYMDQSFIEAHTDEFAQTVRQARWMTPSISSVAEQCRLDVRDVERLFQLFASTERVVTLFSQGINQWSSGTDKGNAIINCHLVTGRIGRPGRGPFSITGQPNAMGGREVGGLANQLAAHMDINNPTQRDLVARFWQTQSLAPNAGLMAVDLFRAIEAGRVKAVWIMATNPAVSLPDSDQVRRALQKCDCVIVSDCMAQTDTMTYADIRLPAQAWGEKEGTVTNSERCISLQRRFLTSPGNARPDWWMICEVAKRLGFAGFEFTGPEEIFDEHARLSGFENEGSRDFDISGLAGLDSLAYQSLKPIQWPYTKDGHSSARMFSDRRFFTGNGRAQFVPVTPNTPSGFTDVRFPLILNTGRVRDQWHTMTRTGKSSRLCGHIQEPFVDIHPDDAQKYNLVEEQLARVRSVWGEAILRVKISAQQPVGQVFAPMHWNDQFASTARISALVNPAVDPVSGQPEFKHTPVAIEPYRVAWYGFILSRRPIQPMIASYWAKVRRDNLWLYELAGEMAPENWAIHAREQLGVDDRNNAAEWRELHDSTRANYRAACIVDGRLDSVMIIAPNNELPSRDWLSSLFLKEKLADGERARLLRGTPPQGQTDPGKVVCSCFSIGINTLVTAIREQNLISPEEVGQVLGAGTNCGSCIPELRRLIAGSAGNKPGTPTI
ncbi:MAG: molybdopterin-dependent oxidoreductase [Gammaproteobacteria bacterium]|nr:molybdopterin-dependent oxidoreductase [Gammaproteobacteria bacterium]